MSKDSQPNKTANDYCMSSLCEVRGDVPVRFSEFVLPNEDLSTGHLSIRVGRTSELNASTVNDWNAKILGRIKLPRS